MKNSNFKLLILNLSSNVIDLSIVFTLSLLFDIVLINFAYFSLIHLFLFLYFSYTLVFYSIWKQTPGKYLMQLKLSFNNSDSFVLFKIFVREIVAKLFLGLILPFLIIKNITIDISTLNPFVILTFLGVAFFSLIFWIFGKKPWWDFLSKTKFERKDNEIKKTWFVYGFLVLFWIFSFFVIRYDNNLRQNSTLKILGFEYPLINKEYPNNSNLKEYIDFLSIQQPNINDYFLELFETKDIVIVCERFHQEMTQWDMIYDLVSDERFIQDVGNIFTEYGPADQQYIVDEYLTTIYENDSLLNIATGRVMNKICSWGHIWEKAPFFYFLKKINLLNASLTDSLKIKIYFTAPDRITDFVTSTEEYSLARKKISDIYDSIMGANVINIFTDIKEQEIRKKCLVITNFSHAFHNNSEKEFNRNFVNDRQASYIFNAFPKGKVANVLINTVCATVLPFYYPPIQKGKWDKALSVIGNKEIGFDFEGSPFGDDFCDMHPGFNKSLKYKDVFTGMIFFKPVKHFVFQHGYPYIISGFENEYKRNYKLAYGDTLNVNKSISNFKQIESNPNDYIKYLFSFGNCIEIIVYWILMFSAFLICLYHVIYNLFRKRNTKL